MGNEVRRPARSVVSNDIHRHACFHRCIDPQANDWHLVFAAYVKDFLPVFDRSVCSIDNNVVALKKMLVQGIGNLREGFEGVLIHPFMIREERSGNRRFSGGGVSDEHDNVWRRKVMQGVLDTCDEYVRCDGLCVLCVRQIPLYFTKMDGWK